MTDGIVWVAGETLRDRYIHYYVWVRLETDIACYHSIPIMIVFSMLLWGMIGRRWYQQWRAIFRLNVLVGDSLNGIRVVKAFGQESTFAIAHRLSTLRNANRLIVLARGNIAETGTHDADFLFFEISICSHVGELSGNSLVM
ncbi:MAG: hypothetical protein WD424_10090 [Paenibacillaceae bacterium]